MGLKDYLKIFQKHLLLIILVVVIATGGAAAFAQFRDAGYSTSVSLTLNRVNTQKTDAYKYDQFYAISASDLFGKTVVAWLSTPSVVQDVFNQAGISSGLDLSGSSKFFKSTKLSSQVVEVRFNYGNEADSKKIVSAIESVLKKEADKLNQQTTNESYVTITAENPVTTVASKNLPIVAGAAFIVSLFLALNLALLVEYLKKEDKK